MMVNFKFEEVEECRIPCATCFWGGAALVVAGVGLAVAVAT